MKTIGPRTPCSPKRVQGLSLIELMIAMVLGLLVVGGAIGIFLSNQQTYRATESLARVQENARVAFELMAREVREAAGNPCAANLPTANILNPTTEWWNNWGNGLVGYENGALALSANGTDAIDLLSATSGGVTVFETPSATSANFKVNTPDHGINPGDIMMVCDYSQASIFEATSANPSNVTIGHNNGNGSPGNCTKGLGLPVLCTGSANGTSKIYGPNSIVVKLKGARWYVADNNRGSRSLYRMTMDGTAAGNIGNAEEVAEGIQEMEIQYLLSGANDYVDAAPGLDWTRVTAVRITLQVQGSERVGTDGDVLTRNISHVVNLRNRTS